MPWSGERKETAKVGDRLVGNGRVSRFGNGLTHPECCNVYLFMHGGSITSLGFTNYFEINVHCVIHILGDGVAD